MFAMPTLLLAALLLVPHAAPPCDVLEEFDIGTDEGPIFVPVTIAGKQYPFLLDTGCTSTGYDLSLRHLMGNEVEKRQMDTTGGLVEVSFCMPPEARLGQLPLPREVPAMLLDMAPFDKRLGAKNFGVLGMDFLTRTSSRLIASVGKSLSVGDHRRRWCRYPPEKS